jgi:sugar phosphate isomerase/epimerase
VKLALDPYMFRTTPLLELPGLVADLGYRHIELSPREDFTPFFLHPRANRDIVSKFKRALDAAGVESATHRYFADGMHIPLFERRTMHTNRAVVDAGRAKVDLWPGSLTTVSQGGSLATWPTAPSPD